MSHFDRSAATYIRALIRLRRAATRFVSTQSSSTASIDRLLRARIREVDAAHSYRQASRNFFRTTLRARLTRRTAR
jgi:hypothetical protein